MLTLFRRIRKSFIHSNLNSRYILYAIGEIALVVIGILVALQINNWNDEKKDIRFERKMLMEIYSSLSADIENLNQGQENQLSLFDANKLIIASLNEQAYNKDEFGELVTSTAANLEIVFQTSAFESLRSKGIELVSDDQVRVQLLDLYDIVYPQLLKSYENYNIHLRNEWRPYMIDNFAYSVTDANSPGDLGFLRLPLDWNIIRKDTRMRNIVLLNQFITKALNFQTENVKEQAQELKSLISTYLKK